MKTQSGPANSVDGYIASFPGDVSAILKKIRATIRKAAPGAEEKMGYGVPAYSLRGQRVYFAAFKRHIGFYPGADVIRAFGKSLAGFKTAKGTVRFPIDQPMPFDLIKRMVLFRIGEKPAKPAGPKKPHRNRGRLDSPHPE